MRGIGRTKSTQNVRRILASQKTFRNFLDDEEAALSLQSQSQSGPGPGPGTRSSRIIKTRRLKAQSQHPSEPPSQLPESDFDTHPLLRSYTPSLPSERIMDALLSEPALSYNSARAGPPGGQGKSQRFFCALCGHWGKIRCKHCQVRTCGLECFRLHEDSRCGAFF